MTKWQVRRTKSKLRWATWKAHSKRKTGVVFDTWREAVIYATCQVKCEKRMLRFEVKIAEVNTSPYIVISTEKGLV